jgi:hypothetical protein
MHVLAASQKGIHGTNEEVGALASSDSKGDLRIWGRGTLEDGLDDVSRVFNPIVLDGGNTETAVEGDAAAVVRGKGAIVEQIAGDLEGLTGISSVIAAQAEVIEEGRAS